MIGRSDLHELLQPSKLLVSFYWSCSSSSLGCNHTDNNKTLMSILSNLLCQRKYYAVSNDFGEKNSWAPVFLVFFNISHNRLSQNILTTEATQIMRRTL